MMAYPNIYNYSKPKKFVKTKINDTNIIDITENEQIKRNTNEEKTDAYLEQRVLNAKSEELTLMLYDGIVKFLNQAIHFNNLKNYEKTNYLILRADAIINELMVTLNKDYEISKNLELMYDYMLRRLVDANIKKDSEIIREVLTISEDLRDTWKEAIKNK